MNKHRLNYEINEFINILWREGKNYFWRESFDGQELKRFQFALTFLIKDYNFTRTEVYDYLETFNYSVSLIDKRDLIEQYLNNKKAV